MNIPREIAGTWEYLVVQQDKFSDFESEVSRKLNDGWQIHGIPFELRDTLCQVVVKFTPPDVTEVVAS